MKYFIVFMLSLSFCASAEFSFGTLVGKTNATQTTINSVRDATNTEAGGISASTLESGWEFSGFMEYRFEKSMMAFQLRPAYFMQSTSGGAYEYATSGPVIALLFRTYPLEGDYMRMYLQFGLNYGLLSLTIKEDTFKTEASGSSLGIQIGGGLQLTFGQHLIMFEAGWRYLPIERNIVDSVSGTPGTGSVDAPTVNNELEKDLKDVGTTMTGVQMMLGYGYRY